MAIQTRQQASGQTIRRWRIVSVAVGAVAMSAALVAGGLGWQRPSAPQTTSSTHIVAEQPAPRGIALPEGPIDDWLQESTGQARWAPSVQIQHAPLGIALPQGANADELPTGLADYLRPGRAEPISGTGSAYDGGTYGVARRASALTRVPYEAGWQLYDNGWAGGPRTAPQSQTGSRAYGAARHPNVPVIGTGSAYDGGAYAVRRPAVPNPNVQVGTGLISDGSAYMEYLIEQAARPSMGPARPAAPNPNVPISGTGSAYDGSHSEALRLAGLSWPGVPVVGTGSAYDGGSYSTARPVVQAQPIGLGIDLPASVNLRELPSGLTDYVRRSP